jgi:hypothetical protein
MVPCPQRCVWEREGRPVGKARRRNPECPWRGTPTKVSRPPQAGDYGEDVGGSATVGWWSDHQPQVQNAAPTAARPDGNWGHQKACLEILPAEDRALPLWAVPELDQNEAHHPVLVVPIPNTDEGTRPQSVPGVEGAAEDLMGGGQEGDREMEEPLEGPGPAGG